MKAVQLAIFPELIMGYAELQARNKFLQRKNKSRKGGV